MTFEWWSVSVREKSIFTFFFLMLSFIREKMIYFFIIIGFYNTILMFSLFINYK